MNKYPVILAGAGIGGIDHLSLGVYRELKDADYIVYDRLLDPRLLDLAPRAEKIYAGKAKNRHTMTQEEINDVLVTAYRAGKKVLRLKGGDPYVFGRGGEEALYLKDRGIPFIIYPGITSGVAVPAMAGIPVTFRDKARSVTFITAYTKDGAENLAPYAALESTLVIYMGLSRTATIAKELIDGGKSPDTPLAVLSKGATPDQKIHITTLGGATEGIPEDLKSPALIVVGDVVELNTSLRPEFNTPAGGRNIVLTGDHHQDLFAQKLARVGFRTIRRPMIDIRPVNSEKLEEDIANFDADTVVLTSKNAVQIFLDAFLKKRDIRDLAGVSFYVVGEKTEAALDAYGLRARGQPSIYDGRHLARYLERELRDQAPVIYYPHSKKSDPALKTFLATSWRLKERVIYDALAPEAPEPLPEAIDAIVFASPSAVTHFIACYGRSILETIRIFAIGPSTRKSLIEIGIDETHITVPARATFDALYEEIVKEFFHDPYETH